MGENKKRGNQNIDGDREMAQAGSLVADLDIPQYDLSRRTEGFKINETKKHALTK